jgi:hypothetical protein
MEPLAIDEAAGGGNSWIHPRRGKNPKSLWAVFELKCPHCDERIKVATPMRGNTTPPPGLLDRLGVNLTGGKNVCPSCGISYRDDFLKNTLQERLEWDNNILFLLTSNGRVIKKAQGPSELALLEERCEKYG